MSTKIYWAEVTEHLNYGTEYHTICYCIERPIDVFKRLCRTHEIYEYKDALSPMWDNVSAGLAIDEAKPPKGCIVVATLQDVLPLLEEAVLKKEKTLKDVEVAVIANQEYINILKQDPCPYLVEDKIASLEEVINALEKIIQEES